VLSAASLGTAALTIVAIYLIGYLTNDSQGAAHDHAVESTI
jgi:hypothetical protein